jgi:tetratricopeptide (TPR) repeat protein
MDLRIEFSSSLANSKAKGKLKEILNAVCAILNSSKQGGKLILFSESGPYSDKNADDITRKIEQISEATFGLEATCEIIDKIPQENVSEMHYQIKQTTTLPSQLYTINYNLYRTSNTQVHNIPSSEPLDRIVEVIKGETTREKKDVLRNHHKTFVYDTVVHLEESKEVQLKSLDDQCTKSLEDRMTNESNKLTHYVSAFANGTGGHIYYGVKLHENGSYVAYGQTVIDREKIINKVKSTIDRMFIWRGRNKEHLNKEQHWDIYFKEVSNVPNTEEAKHVIVISVNAHNRGVFAREPESYVIVDDGKVQSMEFSEWTEKFLLANCQNIFSHEMSPQTIDRGEWSSPRALENHLAVLERLVILRNNGCQEEFEAYKTEMLTDSDANTKCLIQQQEAGDFFRKRSLEKAVAKLEENKKLLKEDAAKIADVDIYQTRRLYWEGVVERAQGHYEECGNLCKEALQKSHSQPTILVLPWIHYNRAKTLEIDVAKEKDTSKERGLRTTCMEYYESALRSSFALQDFPENLVADLKQRVLIAMARVSLGAFYDGKNVVRKTCSPCDVKHADYLLHVVDASVENEGLLMTKLSEAEYLLVRVERYYHSWKERPKPVFLTKALETSKKALETANTKFKAVSEFANGQIAMLEELNGNKQGK